MRMFVVLLLVGICSGLRAAEPKLAAKVEKVAPPSTIAEPVRKLLDEQALVVREGDTEVMTVWFRKAIPVKATEEQVKNGLTYREIPEGTFVGAIRFPAKFTDFRKQEIPAGAYTLRFVVQPDIGDHTGTAPHPEFCLMCQAEKDTKPGPIEKKKLIEVSSLVNEGRHPAVLLMWPHDGKETDAKVVGKGDGVFVATVRRAVVTEEGHKTAIGFAITVAGVRKE